MAKHSMTSYARNSATGSTVSPTSKPVLSEVEGPKTYVVSHPLPPSRISWLRQQSKHVAAVSSRRLGD